MVMVMLKVLLTRLILGVLHAFVLEWLAVATSVSSIWHLEHVRK